MAEGLFLVRKTILPGDFIVNGVHSVLINNDDAETTAQHIAAAVAACNTAYPPTAGEADPFPASYFDTADEVSDLIAGILKDDGDAVIFGDNETREVGT